MKRTQIDERGFFLTYRILSFVDFRAKSMLGESETIKQQEEMFILISLI